MRSAASATRPSATSAAARSAAPARFAGDGVPAQELFARVREVTGREPLVQGAGPERVRRIGIVSGSAADALDEAADARA